MACRGAPFTHASSSPSPADTNDTVLRCAGIERSFGGLKALKGVSLDVYRREIFGLVGPNGSGKTTLVNVVTGFYPPNAGTVTLFDKDITRLTPHAVARRGVARKFQNPAPFRGMSVLPQKMLGRHLPITPSALANYPYRVWTLQGEHVNPTLVDE